MFNFRTTVASSVLFLMFLTGCQTADPYTGEKKASNVTKGAAIGAVLCGLIGSRKGGKQARNAALGCGLIGAGIGAYMDSQEKELRKSLEGTGVGVKREGDTINLIMPGNITFATNRSNIQPSFFSVLNSVAKVFAEYDKTAVEIQGHTDSTGSLSYNLELSENRALKVANYLVEQGVSKTRIIHFGKGPMKPIATNDSSEGRAQNRRVEIRIKAM